ncbi:hypothetical protein MMC25_002451 [Agyrium rufum]|nr:hypothetical protein [Agyrium rufum]
MQSYQVSLLSAVIPRLCVTAFTFSQPFLVDTTVTFAGQPDANKTYGKALIAAWALVYSGLAISNSIYGYQSFRFTTRLRGGLTALVYQRSLQIRAVDQGDITAITLMGTDIERIVSGLGRFHDSWGSLLDICIATWLLERQLSLACIAPIVIVVVFIAGVASISGAINTAQRKWIERVQERLRVTSIFLGDMKAVQMLGLSRVMSNVVQGLRITEIETSKVYRKLLVAMLLLSLTPINLAPVVTFAVYTIIAVYWQNDTLFSAQAFTSVALITLLTTPVLSFIQTLPEIIQCIGCFDRIQQYCNYPLDHGAAGGDNITIDENAQHRVSQRGLTSKSSIELQEVPEYPCLSADGHNFGWSKTSPAFLKDLKFNIKRGSLVALVGPVGSGKTAFLNSLLGEMISFHSATDNVRGRHKLNMHVAYCSQQPWLENGTIRDNIIGGLPFDAKYYGSVTFQCCLQVDFDALEAGDRTRVGSKGLNLSGGQKQRIALARAIYARRSVILLDDVFSGMDAHTVDSISNSLLNPDGYLRKGGITCILATHNHKIMALADTIIAFEDGLIVDTGSPTTLIQNNNGYISKLGLSIENDKEIPDETPSPEVQQSDRGLSNAPQNIQEEINNEFTDVRRKNGELAVYSYYFASSGYTALLLYGIFVGLWVFCTEFSTIWIMWWSNANEEKPNQHVGMYMGVFTALGISSIISVCIGAWFAFIAVVTNSATKLHSDLLEAVVNAPFRLFMKTDSGELLNRFSQDMELVDMQLPLDLVNYSSTVMTCAAQVIILIVFSRYLGATVPFLAVILYVLQRFYLQTSRQIRLLSIEAQAPLFTQFTESVDGAATIRAFGWQKLYQDRNYRLLDISQKPTYMLQCIQHWLVFVLDLIVAAVVTALVAIVVTLKDQFSAGSVGVSLVVIVGFNTILARLISCWTKLESSIGAVARVRRFVTTDEHRGRPSRAESLPLNWPQAGALEFKDLVASYSPSSAPVLKGISLSIPSGHHIAICGRSGSGKSSLILSLLQMIETNEGTIILDGIDVSSLNNADVCSRINVVPQDPFLLPGTTRFNIDPFSRSSDEEIIRALEKVKLWSVIRDGTGLDKEFDVSAWSAGQKQLLCLARAIITKSRLLILDEAMSSVDSQTEGIMQEIIDTEFKGCTVLAIMHRLKHVMSYDRVALLGEGKLLEYDEPAKLMAGDTLFAELFRSQNH